jgi:hypothetical protein
MTKAVLIIWIGLGQSQTLTTEKFDSMEECKAAREAIIHFHGRLEGDCVAYWVPE